MCKSLTRACKRHVTTDLFPLGRAASTASYTCGLYSIYDTHALGMRGLYDTHALGMRGLYDTHALGMRGLYDTHALGMRGKPRMLPHVADNTTALLHTSSRLLAWNHGHDLA